MSQRTFVFGSRQTFSTPSTGNQAARLITFTNTAAGFFKVKASGGTLRVLLGRENTIDAQDGGEAANLIEIKYNDLNKTIPKAFVGADGETYVATYMSIDADADFAGAVEEYL